MHLCCHGPGRLDIAAPALERLEVESRVHEIALRSALDERRAKAGQDLMRLVEPARPHLDEAGDHRRPCLNRGRDLANRLIYLIAVLYGDHPRIRSLLPRGGPVGRAGPSRHLFNAR